ncbi:metal ABC transporter permease [Spirulina subsalsa]|uniref:metal ABC transporter permease n=1 Tax=Spirulina subsalsa TaxID=54311 RepID=UPI0004747E8B|nr:metal ABC transporter permease [Spirulina subsalsa]
MNWLLEPLQFEFMRNAFGMAILLGILCAIVGSYLVVEQMSLMANVISHAILPGLSIAFFLGINLSIGALIAGVLSAFTVAWIRQNSPISVDAAMGLVLSSFLALGVMLIELLRTNRIDLNQLLFGDILSVQSQHIVQTFFITLAIAIIVIIFYQPLLYYTFDPLGAKASGLPVNWIYFGFITAVTLTIIASMQSVGVLLVISLLVGPASTAYLLVKELHWMMVGAGIFGVFSSITGMYLSYYLDLPSGPAIVLVIFALFWVAFLFSPRQGLWRKIKAMIQNQ